MRLGSELFCAALSNASLLFVVDPHPAAASVALVVLAHVDLDDVAVHRLARTFGVSAQALTIKLVRLGLIS